MTFNTIYEIVKHSVENFAERIAFSMIGGEDVSYKEVGERVDKVQDAQDTQLCGLDGQYERQREGQQQNLCREGLYLCR